MTKGWGQLPKWVFSNEDGERLGKSDFEPRVFHKLFPKAGLQRIRFHDLHHTFAARLLQNGERPAAREEQMRHHSIKVTSTSTVILCRSESRRCRSARRSWSQP